MKFKGIVHNHENGEDSVSFLSKIKPYRKYKFNMHTNETLESGATIITGGCSLKQRSKYTNLKDGLKVSKLKLN